MKFNSNWFRKNTITTPKVLVLMYHRVADLKRDPWELAVSPENFEQQLALLRRKYDVITVPELARKLSTHSICSNSICITFDDGYSDNFHVAKPLLEKHECPQLFLSQPNH
jgi:peptidoglycan/xylan/chitin deacetylase (PgdA/CDA1 family)